MFHIKNICDVPVTIHTGKNSHTLTPNESVDIEYDKPYMNVTITPINSETYKTYIISDETESNEIRGNGTYFDNQKMPIFGQDKDDKNIWYISLSILFLILILICLYHMRKKNSR